MTLSPRIPPEIFRFGLAPAGTHLWAGGLPRWCALWLSDQDAVEMMGLPFRQNAPYLRQARFSVFRRVGTSIS